VYPDELFFKKMRSGPTRVFQDQDPPNPEVPKSTINLSARPDVFYRV
jgi:hypothetical protein